MRIQQNILISFVIALLLMTVGTASAEAPAEDWNKIFDTGFLDTAYSVQDTSDGGYILAGVTGDDEWQDIRALLIKTDENGNEEWNRAFGDDAGFGYVRSVQQVSDGGYILAGTTYSYEQSFDAWLIKTDENGNEIWSKTFGGTAYDEAWSVQQTSDGGYILAGKNGIDSSDAWLIKTDENGNEIWSKTFGGIDSFGYSTEDHACSVQQTSDGGYIVAGYTFYSGWLIKTYSTGTEQWNMKFDSIGLGINKAYSVQQTSDGGYILAGYTEPYESDSDAWLVKTDKDGNKIWSKKFGGTYFDEAWSVQQTSDGGYILAGHTIANYEEYSGWLIKTDSTGTEEWNMTLNYGDLTAAYSVRQTLDDGYIIAGGTGSSENGFDALLVKIAGTDEAEDNPVEAIEDLRVYVNNEDLSASTLKTLNKKLDSVITLLNKGKGESAIDKLEGFIGTVGGFEKSKKLTGDQAEYLVTAAENIIKLIEISEG